MDRNSDKYPHVTEWTLVHELIRAALRARFALINQDLGAARDVALMYLDRALMSVDQTHETAEKFRAAVDEFNEEKATGDDTNSDGPTPLISINEEDDGVAGIWISCCEYVNLTADKED